MNTLPGELIAHLFSFLHLPELKSSRLCCKAFAAIGQTYLFQNFEFRVWPNHHRLYQLEQLAQTPDVAEKLQCLSFESGVLLEYADYRYWQAQVCSERSSAWSRTLAAKAASRDDYEEFHADLHARFTTDMQWRYTFYRWHLDKESALVAEQHTHNTLVRVMNKLHAHSPKLHFKLVMSEPQVSLEDVESFDPSQYKLEYTNDHDPRSRVSNRRRHCLTHFFNFLSAALDSNCAITHLNFVDLPHQFLTASFLPIDRTLGATFRTLTHASLKLSGLPHSDWLSRSGANEVYQAGRNRAARQLRILLDQTTSLTSLHLEFPEGKEAEYSYDIFDRTNIDRFPRLWLPKLEHLDFCHFRCTWQDLQALLSEAKSLKSLTLSYCRLETGSMIDFLHFIPSLQLSRVAIGGKWYVDEDSGEWHAHTADDFTDCFAKTTYEGPYENNGMKRRVEEYLLGGKLDGGDSEPECPLPRWTPHGREEDLWELRGDTSWHYLPGLPRVH